MVKDPPHLANANKELTLLQKVLGLLPRDDLTSNLRDVVFICIDCEAFEFVQSKITEIGVAVLDTKDIQAIEPGKNAAAWLAKMQHAHYRPVQYSQFVNRRHVKGCEASFNFGASTWINLADSGTVLDRIFSDPAALVQAADFEVDLPKQRRNIIFVGHGLNNDKTFLNQLGFPLASVTSIARDMDTQIIAGRTKKTQVALQRLLLSLELQPVNLHNGGNDAAYTLQALILMAVKDRESPGSVFSALAAHVGKLPSAVRTGLQAPQVWAGTTTPKDVKAAGWGQVPTAKAMPRKSASRRRAHKQAVRSAAQRDDREESSIAPRQTSLLQSDTVDGCSGNKPFSRGSGKV